MRENDEKKEVHWTEAEPVRYHRKQNQPVSAWVPILLFLLFSVIISGMFGLVALLPLGIAAVLFLLLREKVLRLPFLFYLAVFVIFGFITWNFLSSGPVIPNPIASWIYRNSGLDMRKLETSIVVSDDDFLPARTQAVPSANSVTGSDKDSLNAASATLPETQNDVPIVAESELPAVATKPDSKVFDAFLNRALKAVDDEQYDVANQNFKSAFKANPANPRLKELAAEYKRTADERCQDFKNANAKELAHIPNNYYQYAASLTQTVPLKCD